MNFFAGALATVGSFFASIGSQACIIWMIDEPKQPKSLIK